MKKIIQYLKDFYTVCSFCTRLSIKSSPKYFWLCTLLNMFLVVIPFALIFITSLIVNILATSAVSAQNSYITVKSFIFYSVLLLAVAIINKSLENYKTYCDGMHREIMHKHIKQILMEKTSELDLSYFDSSSFYNEMSDATNNSPLIINTAFEVMDLIKYLIQLVIAIVYLMGYDVLFSVFLLLSIIPNVLFQKKQLDAMYNFQRNNLENERKMYYSSGLIFSRDYVKDVKLYNLFPMICQKFSNAWNILFNQKRKLSFKYTNLLVICSIFPEIVTAVLFFMLGYGVVTGKNTMGDYAYYQGLAGQVLGSMFTVVLNYGQLMDGKIRIQNFLKFINWENKIKIDGKIKYEGNRFNLEFKNVYFRYNDDLPYILNNLSFKINSFEKIAFVGSNGCGKTTAIKLIMRYYDPTEGVILLNGIDLRNYDIQSIRTCFSTLFQDYCKYAFTVSDSVSLSNYNYSSNTLKINDALTKSGANIFVSKFPSGIDTYLTRQYDDNGEELSGGQWQKIASSRTFFRDAAVYIFDEPSSSLDAESEDELFKQFECFYESKTSILVSHRLSNITSADTIFVMENGTIIESGTHSELIRENGRYAYLYKLQSQKYDVVL